MTKFSVKDSDPGFKSLKKNFKGPDSVDIGIFGDQGSDLVIYAATNEFGTDKAGVNKNIVIPERSFLRAGIDEKKKQINRLTAKLAVEVAKGKISKKKALEIIGQTAQAIVQGKIGKGPFKPNESATKVRKGSSRPLIDTGRMRGSITFKVGRR